MVAGVNEISRKLGLLRSLAASHGVDAILLQCVSSVAWATSGAAVYVNTARSESEASLLITKEKRFLFTKNIEAPRLEKEEGLIAQGWDFRIAPWFEINTSLQKLTKGLKLGSDGLSQGTVNLSGEIARLRAELTPAEGECFRALGRLCAEAIDSAIRAVRPGQTEFEIAALLDAEVQRRGAQAIVNLIATDERIFNYRHPLPTTKKLERYAMLVLCGRRQGLVCSITRLVHFGRLPKEIQEKALAVARIDAAMISATRPGRTLGDVFKVAKDEYARAGYPDEWQLHHQGGAAGYEPREYLATPDSKDLIVAGQVYAWNPSIIGSKSEDSVLIGENAPVILTAIPDWPMVKVEVDGKIIERPDILVAK
jgi:Xaa-Pro aminopeptidase